MKFTALQQQAIDQEGENIIVSAGAGSGKTAVLSERVLRKIKQGVPITRLLILTFTNKAAAEMKERIRKKLFEQNLKEALDQIDNSYITTFDSFALSVVKKYHVLLNLSSQIEIQEEAILNLERTKILEELFEELYEKEDPDFLKLLDSFVLKDDTTLKEYVLGLDEAFERLLEKENVFQTYEEHYYGEEHIYSLKNAYLEKIGEVHQRLSCECQNLLSLTENKFQEKLLQVVTPLLESKDYNNIKENIEIKLPSLPRGCDESVKESKKRLSDLLKKLKTLCSYEDEEEMIQEILNTKENTLLLLKIVKELDERFTKYKRQENLYTFMDISRLAITAVKDYPEIREELMNSFDEIMVDEYQDTNDIQEAFLSYISSNNVYMVGDMKQSIYRFRNANPMIFKNKYDHYKKNEGGSAIDLSSNFRSRSEVLDDINLLFSRLMDDKFGGVTYEDGHAMIFGNKLYLEEKQDKNYYLEVDTYEDNKDDEMKGYEKEIFIIGADIQEKMKEGYQVFDKDSGHLRPITYSDFAILLDRSKYFDTVKKIFEYLGIPLAVEKEEKLLGELDLELLKNMFFMIKLIKEKNFQSEFRHCFASLSRSFLYQMSEQELYDYLTTNTFFESEIYQTFSSLVEFYDTTTPNLLLSYLLEITHYEEKLILKGNIKNFRKRMEYIYHLATTLTNQGKTNDDFLSLLQEIIDTQIEMGVSYQKEEGNAVYLMSIHKSKGLEFPICYFADFNHSFNFQELKDKIKFHPDYGILIPIVTKEEEHQTICEVLLKDKVKEDEISERIRLFYVALTRAREKMIIVSPRITEEKIAKEEMLSFQKMLLFLYPQWQEKEVKIETIPNMSKDYLLPKRLEKIKLNPQEKIIFREEDNLPLKEKDTTRLSKTMINPLSLSQEENVELGLQMHEIFERIDFENPNYDSLVLPDDLKKSVQVFLESDFLKQNKNGKIYREYEFLEELDNKIYHGIIDLLILKEDEAIILDYKLKNIKDKAYNEQLLGYKKVIEKRTGLKTRTYLYSILEQKLQEIFDK